MDAEQHMFSDIGSPFGFDLDPERIRADTNGRPRHPVKECKDLRSREADNKNIEKGDTNSSTEYETSLKSNSVRDRSYIITLLGFLKSHSKHVQLSRGSQSLSSANHKEVFFSMRCTR